MTGEKAPSPLPEVLPVGTRWAQGGQHGHFKETAALISGQYRGLSSRIDRDDLRAVIFADSIDWSSVAALRSPPSPPSEGPKVGETWQTNCAGWPEVVIREVIGDTARCTVDHSDIRGSFTFGPDGSRLHRLIRRLTPAASPDKWEPKVGDECEGVGIFSGIPRRGILVDLHHKDGPQLRESTGNSPNVRRETLRLIRPATPSPKVEEVPKCALHRTENCINCADAARALAATKTPPKLDPDGRYPNTGFPSAQDLENHAVARDRDLAAIKQHLADFDRKLPTRGKWDWDVDDAEESRVS